MEPIKRLRINSPIKFLVVLSLCLGWIFYQTDEEQQFVFPGQTMGTTYEVKIWANDQNFNRQEIQSGIDSILSSVNNSMSTYINTSEISLFNKNQTENKIAVSDDFYYVLDKSIDYNQLTDGTFDPTIRPLLTLWGFRGKEVLNKPDTSMINDVLEYVGSDKILLHSDNYIQKTHPMLSLDFGAIAKGYAVDQISDYLNDLGYKQHYVEIGGDMICKGKNWTIGVAYPEFISGQVYKKINLNNHAVATSGTYNQSIEIDDFEYSHIFDPRIGQPSKNNVVSVTVISSSCIYSDALATSLKVLGKDKGLDLIDSLKDVECMFIVKEDGEFKDYLSDNFSSFFVD